MSCCTVFAGLYIELNGTVIIMVLCNCWLWKRNPKLANILFGKTLITIWNQLLANTKLVLVDIDVRRIISVPWFFCVLLLQLIFVIDEILPLFFQCLDLLHAGSLHLLEFPSVGSLHLFHLLQVLCLHLFTFLLKLDSLSNCDLEFHILLAYPEDNALKCTLHNWRVVKQIKLCISW